MIKTFSASKVIVPIYGILFVLFLGLITWYSVYCYAAIPDAIMYALGKDGVQSMLENYNHVNGRWAQGLTNDYKFYEFRYITIPLITRCAF